VPGHTSAVSAAADGRLLLLLMLLTLPILLAMLMPLLG
jgi:hypothetical protein